MHKGIGCEFDRKGWIEKMTKIWAHRGASGYAPENTLEAFGLAVEQKADGVELDVQLTKDDKIVVIHDERLERVSGQRGFVKDFALEELKALNVSRPIEEYRETKIPTLEEVYDLLKGTGLTINVEIKSSLIWYPEIERKTIELTRRMGMEDKVLYSSFNHYSLRKIKEIAPEAKTGILYSDVLCDIVDYCKNVGADALHPAYMHRYMDSVWEEYQNSGIPFHIWTVNEEEDMRFFFEHGVDAIITNYPDKAFKMREEMLPK